MKPFKSLTMKTYGKQIRKVSAWLSPENRKQVFDSSLSTDGDISVFEPSNNPLKRYVQLAKFLSYFFLYSSLLSIYLYNSSFQNLKFCSIMCRNILPICLPCCQNRFINAKICQNLQIAPYYVNRHSDIRFILNIFYVPELPLANHLFFIFFYL